VPSKLSSKIYNKVRDSISLQIVLKETSSTLSNEQLKSEIARLKAANEDMSKSLERYEGG
jgi:hypothetical protein